MYLYYNSFVGTHLMKNADGHLASECCCGWADNPAVTCFSCSESVQELMRLREYATISVDGFSGTSAARGSNPNIGWYQHSYSFNEINGTWFARFDPNYGCLWHAEDFSGPYLVNWKECDGWNPGDPVETVVRCFSPRPSYPSATIQISQASTSFWISAHISWEDWIYDLETLDTSIGEAYYYREFEGYACDHDWLNSGWPITLELVSSSGPSTYSPIADPPPSLCNTSWGERIVTNFVAGETCVIDFPARIPSYPLVDRTVRIDWTEVCPS